MPGTDELESFGERIDGVAKAARSGALTAEQAEDQIVDVLDDAFAVGGGDESGAIGFVDRALTVVGELSDDPRIGRATMYATVRAHLDRLASHDVRARRLEDRLATIRVGLSFDCDTEHLELVMLCREGRSLEPLLYTDAARACAVVDLAAEFDVIHALDATVRGTGDAWERLGQHHVAWERAFDALGAVAWNPAHPRAEDARQTLLDLLGDAQTALDAAVRIRPAWLADGHLHRALDALDAVERWRAMQPAPDPSLDARFGAIEHAVTSLVWLAQDARRSAEVHTLWSQPAGRT